MRSLIPLVVIGVPTVAVALFLSPAVALVLWALAVLGYIYVELTL